METGKGISNHTPTVSARIPIETLAAIKKEARRKDVSISNAVSQAIVYWVGQHLQDGVERTRIISGGKWRNEGYDKRGEPC